MYTLVLCITLRCPYHCFLMRSRRRIEQCDKHSAPLHCPYYQHPEHRFLAPVLLPVNQLLIYRLSGLCKTFKDEPETYNIDHLLMISVVPPRYQLVKLYPETDFVHKRRFVSVSITQYQLSVGISWYRLVSVSISWYQLVSVGRVISPGQILHTTGNRYQLGSVSIS